MCLVPAKPQRRYCICGPGKLNICGQLKIQHKTLICGGNYPETAWRACKLHKLTKASLLSRGSARRACSLYPAWLAGLPKASLPCGSHLHVCSKWHFFRSLSLFIFYKRVLFRPCYFLSLFPYLNFFVGLPTYLSCYVLICLSVSQEC